MRITSEQESILDSFTCERLSSNSINKEVIQNFHNVQNCGLVDYLKEIAWNEDIEGHTAFYLIKNSNGEAVFFFSLKCGALFEHLDENSLENNVLMLESLQRALTGNIPKEDMKKAQWIVEKLRTGKPLSTDELLDYIGEKVEYKRYKKETLAQEKTVERNKHIVRVNNTYSGIELVHFCANDNTKDSWKKHNIQHPLGEVVFWKFIFPIIHNIQEIIGCQYAFLFAADLSEEGSLKNYYRVVLHFEEPDGIGVSKPFYDFCCTFMCQEIKKLRIYEQQFFDNFNPDSDEETI